MADWYASSVAYAAIPTFAINHAYSIGDIIRPTSPANLAKYPQRCTTAGTSGGTEPTWSTSNNATTASGTATFTNVGGQSTYGWSAATGNLYSLTSSAAKNPVPGDRIFVSSDSTETDGQTYLFGATAVGALSIVSVNRAGSFPPVAADITAGALVTCSSGALTIDSNCHLFIQGVSFTAVSASNININSSGAKRMSFKDMTFTMLGTSGFIIQNNPVYLIWDNVKVSFSNASQSIKSSTYPFELLWMNSSAALPGAAVPSTLFANGGGGAALLITCSGVDLSAETGTLCAMSTSGPNKILLESCKINTALTRYGAIGTTTCGGDVVELINCHNGTSVVNEKYTAAGSIVYDTSTYLTTGAQDDVGNFSLKMVSNTNSDIGALPLEAFTIAAENTTTGSSKTATVEIISSAALNTNEIVLQLEYMGTSANPLASFGTTLTSILTTGAAITTSSSAWTGSPATPSAQYLQVTFTPQRAGIVRGRVLLGKTSKTVWVDPVLTIT